MDTKIKRMVIMISLMDMQMKETFGRALKIYTVNIIFGTAIYSKNGQLVVKKKRIMKGWLEL